MTILSNTQAVAARAAASLSQSFVAKDIGISRAYLSQFESGKRILEDRWLIALKEYYQARGWNPESSTSSAPEIESDNIRIRDGFQISGALEEDEIESLLENYYSNQLEIEALSGSEVPRGSIFQSVAKEKALKIVFQVFCLTAQQDDIVRKLRGHDTVFSISSMPYREMETTGQFAGSLIADRLGLQDASSEDDEHQWLDAEIL